MENYPLMSSSVLPLEKSQEAITELKPENFKISFGGADYDSLYVISFEESGAGMSILLCVDVSGSMRGEPLESIKLALLGFVEDMRPIDEIAIAAFAGDWSLISDFSRETAYLKAKITSLSVAPGNTAMYYGAHKSLEQFTKTASNKAQVMILLGDGKDENPVGSYTEAGVSTIQTASPFQSLRLDIPLWKSSICNLWSIWRIGQAGCINMQTIQSSSKTTMRNCAAF
jgi:hypothetical protein